MNNAYEPLKLHIERQLSNMLCAEVDVGPYLDGAVRRTEHALSFSSNKYNCAPREYPNPYHSGQYCMLLYFLSNEMFLADKSGVNAEKVYYLNKALNSVELFYDVSLPSVFGVEHPLGSVMGRASFGNKLFFYQGCTVGGSGGSYPVLGEGLIMYSNSKILGCCNVGSNVIMSANSYIIDRDVPDNSVVFGQGRDAVIRPISPEKYKQMTTQFWK